MGASPAKFLFDDDFAAPNGGKPPMIPLTDHTAKVKDAEVTSYGRGFAQAQTEAKTDAAQRSAAALERIAAAVQAIDKSLAGVTARLETEAVEVAVAVASKLAPELVAREPLAEMTALATGCFRHLVAAPHVVVRVNEGMHESAKQAIDEVVRRCGLESRLVVLAEPEIAPGDCRIEWADGGIVRDSAATAAAIEEAVSRYIEARLASASMQGVPWRSDR
jgi:flagellar assembly protein FliH